MLRPLTAALVAALSVGAAHAAPPDAKSAKSRFVEDPYPSTYRAHRRRARC